MKSKVFLISTICFSDSASRDHQNVDELKLARRNYEDKIRRLEIENNELNTLRAQYAVCVKDGEYYKKELSKHTNELKDLRKMKVQLTRELRQEFMRHRQAEQAKAREIATLKRVFFLCLFQVRKCFSILIS